MATFKQAAIKILKKASKSLHYEEITKKALEQNLIETSGATPEASMNAQITTDIKKNKNLSPFVKKGKGFYEYNINFKEKKQKVIEIEETPKEKLSTQYIGKAGKYLVASELLFRGYNASLMGVDEGVDIVAIKENKLFNIQVKTSNLNKFNMYISDINISSFEKHNSSNTYYIFVLKGDETNFLILPYHKIQELIGTKIIKKVNKDTRYRVNIKIRENIIYLGNLNNNISYYLNNWELIK